MDDVLSVDEFRKHVRRMWAERGFTINDDDRVGVPVPELVSLSAQRNANLTLPYVDLWVAILDECISWFISLNYTVYVEIPEDRGASDLERSIFLVLSKIIADSLAFRHLILTGFDSSARTILRSLSEYMEVLVAVLHQPNLSTEFLASDTPESAQRFWETHLRGGKIRRKVTAAWNDFFKGEETSTAEWFANWGRGSQSLLSGTAHPSSAGGIFAAIAQKVKYTDENWLGIWGDKAEISVDTIFIYTQYVFPILLLSRGFPFEGCADKIQRTYDESNELHRHLRVGRDILSSIILSIGSEGGKSHLFPEFDMSIWPD